MLPEVRQAVLPGRRGALPRHLQNVLLGVTDMTNELLTLRQQNVDKEEEIGKLEEELASVRLELETEQRVSDERAEEIERLLEEGEDTLAVRMEVRNHLKALKNHFERL
jgi:chromosome segregation ATPase